MFMCFYLQVYTYTLCIPDVCGHQRRAFGSSQNGVRDDCCHMGTGIKSCQRQEQQVPAIVELSPLYTSNLYFLCLCICASVKESVDSMKFSVITEMCSGCDVLSVFMLN